MQLALVQIHHLVITGNVPLDMMARFFKALCNWAVVEFVPKSDEKVVGLLANREDIFPRYTEEHFEMEFGAFFDISSKQRINGSKRTLYLMRGI